MMRVDNCYIPKNSPWEKWDNWQEPYRPNLITDNIILTDKEREEGSKVYDIELNISDELSFRLYSDSTDVLDILEALIKKLKEKKND